MVIEHARTEPKTIGKNLVATESVVASVTVTESSCRFGEIIRECSVDRQTPSPLTRTSPGLDRGEKRLLNLEYSSKADCRLLIVRNQNRHSSRSR
ncbi:hypothetical protein O181_048603 [Austropuccinia psidii MF-1]|uniref:Uncharacterized protein n=1 Tax=Austropuccinia psidii MF-1 TaxID=1389203 RepID=A0A9Q3DYB0_9BASI|nr:hypothetical protein [Austropuccinia psidii MF-1]